MLRDVQNCSARARIAGSDEYDSMSFACHTASIMSKLFSIHIQHLTVKDLNWFKTVITYTNTQSYKHVCRHGCSWILMSCVDHFQCTCINWIFRQHKLLLFHMLSSATGLAHSGQRKIILRNVHTALSHQFICQILLVISRMNNTTRNYASILWHWRCK